MPRYVAHAELVRDSHGHQSRVAQSREIDESRAMLEGLLQLLSY